MQLHVRVDTEVKKIGIQECPSLIGQNCCYYYHFYYYFVWFFYYLAVWNQYDDTIFSPPSWLQSARNKMPFLKKSMDLAQGRKIATRAMLPDWKGFTLKGGKTSLSAWEGLSPWEAIETVNDLAFCMTQAHVEEKNRVYKNVPPSYDFSKVRQC